MCRDYGVQKAVFGILIRMYIPFSYRFYLQEVAFSLSVLFNNVQHTKLLQWSDTRERFWTRQLEIKKRQYLNEHLEAVNYPFKEYGDLNMRIISLAVISSFFPWLLHATELWVPHLTSPNGGFSTTLTIRNHSPQIQTWTIYSFKQSGEVLPDRSGTLAIGDVFSGTAASVLPVGASHCRVEVDSEQVSVNVAYQNTVGQGSPAHVLASSRFKESWRLLPGNWEVIFDGFAVVNMGDTTTQVMVKQFDFNGQEIRNVTAIEDLNPGAKGLFVIGAPGDSPFDPREDAFFEVSADENLALTALRGTPPGSEVGYLWENAPMQDMNSHDINLMIAHLTKQDGGFTSQITIHNPTSSTQSLTLTPFDRSGTELNKTSSSIPSKKTWSFSPEQLFQNAGDAEVSHFKVERSSSELVFGVAYETTTGIGSPAHVYASSEVGTSWAFDLGNWDEVFDGFAVVNLGYVEANIYVQQLMTNSSSKQSTRINCEKVIENLQPNAKGLFVLGGPGTSSLFEHNANTYFRIFCPVPIALIPLRGSVPGSPLGVLWQNKPFRLFHLGAKNNPVCEPEDDGLFTLFDPYASHSRAINTTTNKDDPQVFIDVKFVEVSNSLEREVGLELQTNVNGSITSLETSIPENSSQTFPISVDIPVLIPTIMAETTLDFNDIPLTRSHTFDSGLGAGPGVIRIHNLLSHPDRAHLGRGFPVRGQIMPILHPVLWQTPIHRIPFANPPQEIDTHGGQRELLILVTPQIIEDPTVHSKRNILDDILPCGETEFGLVLCPETEVGEEHEIYHFVFESVRAPIPTGDPDHYYQYGIVFDSDDNPDNNWVAHPDFPGDVYQGTDQWYSAEYRPNDGWKLKVSEIINGAIVPMASDAKMVIAGESMILIVPASEFESADPKYRVTTYEHTGDYGNNTPWSGDVHPEIDEPLASMSPAQQ